MNSWPNQSECVCVSDSITVVTNLFSPHHAVVDPIKKRKNYD